MRISYALIFVALANLAACARSSTWPLSGVYKGYYTFGYELTEFVPAGTSEKWSLTGRPPCAPAYGPDASHTRYVVVRGTLSTEGRHGHLGQYSRELTAQEFLERRELSPDEHPKL
jgi:hypothetical protein